MHIPGENDTQITTEQWACVKKDFGVSPDDVKEVWLNNPEITNGLRDLIKSIEARMSGSFGSMCTWAWACNYYLGRTGSDTLHACDARVILEFFEIVDGQCNSLSDRDGKLKISCALVWLWVTSERPTPQKQRDLTEMLKISCAFVWLWATCRGPALQELSDKPYKRLIQDKLNFICSTALEKHLEAQKRD